MKDNLQQRLSAFEAPPPADAWPRIAAALEENGLAQRLEDYAPPPPPGAWAQIAAALGQQAAPSLPAAVRRLRPWALAAAAVLVLLAGGLYLNLRDGSGSGVMVQDLPLPLPANENQDTVRSGNPAPAAAGPTVLTVSTGGSGLRPIIQRMARRAGLVSEPAKTATATLRSFREVSVAPTAMIPQEAVRPQPIAYSMPSERYLIYSDDQGRAMRMPCRLYDMIACGDGDDACRQRLAQLQQQAAMSGGLTTDFTGMLELLRRLGENQ